MRLRKTIFITTLICLLGAISASDAWAKEIVVLRFEEFPGTPHVIMPVESPVFTFLALGTRAESCHTATYGTLLSNSDAVDYISGGPFVSAGCWLGETISGAIKTVKLLASEGADQAIVEPVSDISYAIPGPCVYDFATFDDDHNLHDAELLEYGGEAQGTLNASESKTGCAATLKTPFQVSVVPRAELSTGADTEVLKTGPEPLLLSALGSQLRKGTEVIGYIQVSDPRLGSAVYSDVYLQGKLKSNSDPTDVITVKKTTKDINSGDEQGYLSYRSGKVKELELAGLTNGAGELTALGSKLTLELSERGINCAYELNDIESGLPLPGAIVGDTGSAVGMLVAKHSNAGCAAVQSFHVLVEINSTREMLENIEAAI